VDGGGPRRAALRVVARPRPGAVLDARAAAAGPRVAAGGAQAPKSRGGAGPPARGHGARQVHVRRARAHNRAGDGAAAPQRPAAGLDARAAGLDARAAAAGLDARAAAARVPTRIAGRLRERLVRRRSSPPPPCIEPLFPEFTEEEKAYFQARLERERREKRERAEAPEAPRPSVEIEDVPVFERAPPRPWALDSSPDRRL